MQKNTKKAQKTSQQHKKNLFKLFVKGNSGNSKVKITYNRSNTSIALSQTIAANRNTKEKIKERLEKTLRNNNNNNL